MSLAGNFYGKGNERVHELIASCDNLGIALDRVFIVNDFEDNPQLPWKRELVANVVKQHLVKTGARVVLTFDNYGVSGHLNHIATFRGVR